MSNSKLEKRLKQLEGLSYQEAFPEIQFDLVRLVVETREETERLRRMSEQEFNEYLAIAEKELTNIDPSDYANSICLIAKKSALRRVLQEKNRQSDEAANQTSNGSLING